VGPGGDPIPPSNWRTAGRKKATGSSYFIRSKGKKRKNDFGRNGLIYNGILLSLKQKIAWSILTPLAIAEDYTK